MEQHYVNESCPVTFCFSNNLNRWNASIYSDFGMAGYICNQPILKQAIYNQYLLIANKHQPLCETTVDVE